MKNTQIIILILAITGIIFAQSESVEIKDSDTNTLMQIDDKGATGELSVSSAIADSLILNPLGGAPDFFANKLYNVDSALYWAGSQLGTSGNDGDWTISGNDMYSTNSGNVGIGLTTPAFKLDIDGKIGIDGIQVLYLPNQTTYEGTIVIGNGGGFLSDLGGTYDGHHNIAIGMGALEQTTTGYDNIFIGHTAGQANQGGHENTFVGWGAGQSNIIGNNNNYFGNSAGLYSTGNNNNFYGEYAGFQNTGNNNIFIGKAAGFSNTSGDDNLFIGYQAGYNETGSDKLYIENSDSDTPLIGGDFSADEIYLNGYVGIGTTTPNVQLSVIGSLFGAIHAETTGPASAVYGISTTSNVPNMESYGGRFKSAADLGRGVYGYAEHGSGINYGVRGKTNSSNGYAGYFEGRGYFSGNVGIGTTSPEATLHVNGSIKFGSSGKKFSEIREYTGTTHSTNNSISVTLPTGYTETNTRVLSVEINYTSSRWVGIGRKYGQTDINDNVVSYQVDGSSLFIFYPDHDFYKDEAFRVLLMQIQ